MKNTAKPNRYLAIGLILIGMGILTAVLGPHPDGDIPTQNQSNFFTLLFIFFGLFIIAGNYFRSRLK